MLKFTFSDGSFQVASAYGGSPEKRQRWTVENPHPKIAECAISGWGTQLPTVVVPTRKPRNVGHPSFFSLLALSTRPFGTPGMWPTRPILDTTTSSPGVLPAEAMYPGLKPGTIDLGIETGHEFGHVRYEWGGFWRHALDSSNRSAVALENDVRRLKDPNGETRNVH